MANRYSRAALWSWLLLAMAATGLARAATPEEAVKTYMAALQARDAAAAAASMHPAEVERFRAMLMPNLRKAGELESLANGLQGR